MGSAKMRMNAGYLTFVEFTPPAPVALTKGGIALPDGVVNGKNDNSKVIWGRVYAAGESANRSSCEPYNPEVQLRVGFPLPHGTWIVLRGANHWTLAQDLKALQTHDVVAHFPPEMSWKQIEAELHHAPKSLFAE